MRKTWMCAGQVCVDTRPAVRTGRWLSMVCSILALAISVAFGGAVAMGQTGGEGAIEGSVTDPSGAIIGGATVTATNTATGVQTTRPTSSGGLYNISPLIPGIIRSR